MVLSILFLFAVTAQAQLGGDGIHYGGGGGTGTTLPADAAGVLTNNGSGTLSWGVAAGDVASDAVWDAAGDLVQGTGPNAAAKLTKGAEGTIPRAGATSLAYTTATYPATTTVNRILFSSANNVIDQIAVGAEGSFLRYGASPFVPGASTLILPNAGSAFYLPVFTAANTMGQLAASGTTGQILTAVTGAVPAWASSLTGSLTFSNGATPGSIYFQEGSGGGTNTVQLIAPASTADVVVTLPAATGSVVVSPLSTTNTQALFATATSGLAGYRAIAAGDLPGTLTSGTAITNAALTTPAIGAATGASLVLTGTIQAGVTISSDADGMTAADMTTAGVKGTMFIATGAGTWILPDAAGGESLCLMSSGSAANLILDVTAGSTIRLKGTEQADGIGITQAAAKAAGDFVCVVAVAAHKWSTVGIGGTWVSQ